MSRIHDFTKTIYYIIIVYAVVLLSWSLYIDAVGIVIISLFASFLLFTRGPIEGLIPLMFGTMFISRKYLSLKAFPYMFFICAIIVFAGIVYYFIRNRKNIQKPKMIIGFALFALCSCLSLFNLNANGQNIRYLYSLAPIAYLGVYVFFSFFLGKNKEKYISLSILFLGILLSLELIIEGLSLGSFSEKIITLGWGGANTVSIFVNLAIVACCYLLCVMEKKKETIFIVLLLFFLIFMQFLTLSRAGVITLFVAFVPLIIVTLKKAKQRDILNISLLIGIIIVLILFIALSDDIFSRLSSLLNKGFDDNGRIDIWNDSIEGFKNHPIIGNGLFSYGVTTIQNDYNRMMVCHNTYIQCLFSFGILGLISLIIHFFEKYRILYKNMTLFKVFYLLFSLIAFCQGMIDNTYFMIYFMLVYIIILVGGERNEKKDA